MRTDERGMKAGDADEEGSTKDFKTRDGRGKEEGSDDLGYLANRLRDGRRSTPACFNFVKISDLTLVFFLRRFICFGV